MRYPLRTLLIALGVAPPLLAGLWFAGPLAWAIVLLAAVTGPAIYWWVAEPRTAIGLVVHRIVVLLVLQLALLALAGVLLPAVH